MCEFIDNNSKCGKKKCYGEYCTKHKREYLVVHNFISFSNFTDKSSDYLKNDILNTINYIDKKKYNKSLKKEILFNILSNKFTKFNHYKNNSESVIKIQLYYKNKYKNRNIRLRGLGFINRDICNNKEDFYTYETINEIDNKYFFSYKDNNKIVWFFDVRSINKLMDMNQPNPYTMQDFDLYTRFKVKKIIEYLTNNNISIDFKDEIKEIEKDKKKLLKQKITDVFASIERLGLSVNTSWFTSLNIIQLKKIYGLMEDIWNYRAQLSQELKNQICPPDGRIFNKHPHEIRNTTDKNKMMDYILTDINKFNNAVSDGDKRTGFMYFLISLSKVNPLVLDIHPWMASV